MSQITSFQGEYRWLSNFWEAPITIAGLTFPTSEHVYQASKSLDPKDWQAISECVSPGAAKRMGRRITVRPNWDEVKLNVMREVTSVKYNWHSDLREKLMATKGIELIEGNTWGDTFWGVCNGKGENHLGRILMEYRDR